MRPIDDLLQGRARNGRHFMKLPRRHEHVDSAYVAYLETRVGNRSRLGQEWRIVRALKNTAVIDTALSQRREVHKHEPLAVPSRIGNNNPNVTGRKVAAVR